MPTSIERRGSVRDFWIGRLFRLFPAYLVVIAIAVLVGTLGPGWLPGDFEEQPGTFLLGHLTMLHEVIGADNLQHQFWTLAYEMLFYLLVTVPLIEAPWWQRSLAAAGYLTILLVASYVCYRFVEMPFQSLGRRVVKRIAQRA